MEEEDEEIQPSNLSGTDVATPRQLGARDPSGYHSRSDEGAPRNEGDVILLTVEEKDSKHLQRVFDEILKR